MSTTTAMPAEFYEMGKALGMTEAEVEAMWQRSLPTAPTITEVTRWTRCPECKSRANRTITWAGGNSGAWSCSNDSCWAEFVDEFRFTKDEVAFFEGQEGN